MNATGCSPSFNAAGIYTLGLFTGTGICVFHCECERATERKTVKEGPGQRLNVCVVCVCVQSGTAIKSVSQGYINLITKPVIIHHVPYKSQLC